MYHISERQRDGSMFSSSAQKAKISAHAMRKQLRLRIHLSGKQGRKRAYPSSHNGSLHEEMTGHKRSTKPSMINRETRGLEARSQSQSKTFSIFSESVGCAHVLNRFNEELDAF